MGHAERAAARLTALDPEEIRALVRECVTFVAPGQTLVLRLEAGTPLADVRASAEAAAAVCRPGGVPVLVAACEEIGVAEGGD
jgi:hypothetical protein